MVESEDNNYEYLIEEYKKMGSFKLPSPPDIPRVSKNDIHVENSLNNIMRDNLRISKMAELATNPTYDLIEKQEAANELLSQIVENTSVLKEIVEINRETQLSTEELNGILRDIHAVATAKNKKEADSLFKKAIDTINTSGETAGNITNLVSLLMGIYSTVQPLINN